MKLADQNYQYSTREVFYEIRQYGRKKYMNPSTILSIIVIEVYKIVLYKNRGGISINLNIDESTIYIFLFIYRYHINYIYGILI